MYTTEDMNHYSYKFLEDRMMKSKEIDTENSHEEADSKVNAYTHNIFIHLDLFFTFRS